MAASSPAASPASSTTLRWRILNDGPCPGHVNMARDHALARSLGAGEGVLRFYRWSSPTISFGRNEPARGNYSEEEARREGVAFVRRPTGGRAVLHDEELTYAAVFPVRALGGLKRAYRLVNEGLLRGLLDLGVAVGLAPEAGRSLPPDAGPCFRQPAAGEVTAMGRKLIGSAQVRLGQSVLQHGSIILNGDQELLRRLRSDDEPVPPPATLRSLLERVPEAEELASALAGGLAGVLGGSWVADRARREESMAAEELEAHYLDEGWTWRY